MLMKTIHLTIEQLDILSDALDKYMEHYAEELELEDICADIGGILLSARMQK